MRPFKRTVEKVLSWIANAFLILMTGALWYMHNSGILHDPRFVAKFKEELAKRPDTNIGYTADQLINQLAVGLKYYAIFYIVLTIIAIIATILIKKRIVSGILLLLVAIITAVTSGGVLIPSYLLHFIVAIMLFVRKDQGPAKPLETIETINYL